MALIICEDCGKKISNKAKACIHCGCPIELVIYDFEDKVEKNMKVCLKKVHYRIVLLSYGECKMEVAEILRSIYNISLVDALEKIKTTPCILFRDIEKVHADKVIEKLDKLDVEYRLYVNGALKFHYNGFIWRSEKGKYNKKTEPRELELKTINRLYIWIENIIKVWIDSFNEAIKINRKMVKANIKTTINADIEVVWDAVMSLENFGWRSDLKDVEVLENKKFLLNIADTVFILDLKLQNLSI